MVVTSIVLLEKYRGFYGFFEKCPDGKTHKFTLLAPVNIQDHEFIRRV
jgi:hypothetical protein